MNKIYKYTLNMVTGTQYISMPKDSSILKIDIQCDVIVIWVLFHEWHVDDLQCRTFEVAYTGVVFNYSDIKYNYIDTLTSDSGIVYHVFEVLNNYFS